MDCAAVSRILEISRNLARPMELNSTLTEVVNAACDVLDAERCTVWLYDEAANEFFSQVMIGMDSIRIPADRGLVGSCGRTRQVINVPDCYADPRFDRSVDQSSGYKTRCLLSVPLVGLDDALIGVMQILNQRGGPFTESDIETATALSAQCAVALQRARMLDELLIKERLERELAVARQIQSGTFPRRMPVIDGYDIDGCSHPAEETGGDTFDVVDVGSGRHALLVADATGHGVGPALSVTQVRSMLRMAVHLGFDLETAFRAINRQLAEDLPPERFVTAFLGVLDSVQHSIRYISGGQGPLLHLRASTGEIELRKPSTMPLGVLKDLPSAKDEEVVLMPGDVFAVITDGIPEAENVDEMEFGVERCADLMRVHGARSMAELRRVLVEEARDFTDHGPQADDMTVLLVKRRDERH